MSLDALLAELASGDGAGRGQLLADASAALDRGDPETVAEYMDAIAASAARGSRLALEVLLELIQQYRLAQPPIRRYLIGEADIDDAEQTTLTAVALRIGAFSGNSKFTTWLYSVAANEAKMLIRRESRRPDPVDPARSGVGYLARISSVIADRTVIDAAVDMLDEDFRIPLLLREAEGLSYEEIAARLEIPIGTVRSRLARARRAVAEHAADAIG